MLKASAILESTDVKLASFGAIGEVILPSDYLHLLNCICIYQLNKDYKCKKEGD